MLKKLMFVSLCSLLLSTSALADFDYAGEGSLLYPTGMEKAFTYGFAFKQGENGYFFKVGEQKMSTSEVPSKYTIWLTLHKNENVFVQEFGKGYFKGFVWKLGDHTVELKKQVFKKERVKGDYVLLIDGEEFYFKGNSGQLNIMFNKKGISAIDTDGFVKNRGFSKN